MSSLKVVTVRPKIRLANIELLRVLAMVLIVTNHFMSHGLQLMDYDFEDPSSIYNWTVRGIAYMGTNLFILISAFFMCKSSFKTRGLLLLFAQTLFYSVLLYFLTYLFGWHDINYKELLFAFLPLTTCKYWFVTCYVALYILSPFLNLFIDTLVNRGKKRYLTFLAVILLFFSVIPSFFFFSQWLNWGGSSGIVWFIVLYFIGGYIRNFISIESLKNNGKSIWIYTTLLWFLPLFSKLIIAYTSYSIFGEVIGSSVFYVKNSILLLPASVMTFLAFFTFDIKNDILVKSINWVATGIFAIYLIHDNIYINEHLWNYVRNHIHPGTLSIVYESVLVVSIVFWSCILFDIIRKAIFKVISMTQIPQKLTTGFINKMDSIMKIC